MIEIRYDNRNKVSSAKDSDLRIHSSVKSRNTSKGTETTTKNDNNSPRIPKSLQNIFLRSNAGLDMENVAPPPCAEKVYFRDVRVKMTNIFNLGGKNVAQQLKQQQKQKQQFDEKNKRSLKNSKYLSKKIPALPRLLFHRKRGEKQEEIPNISPEIFVTDLMRSHGYSTQKQSTTESEDYAVPRRSARDSGLCKKSMKILDCARSGNDEELIQLIEKDSWLCLFVYENSRGAYGETLVHMICRYCKNKETLSTFLEQTGIENLQVLDNFGRTPLHYLCWRGKKGEDNHPCIGMVDIIMTSKKKKSRRRKTAPETNLFLMKDVNGWSPLSYVPKQQWKEWNEYLDSKKNVWWKKRMTSYSVSSTTSSMMSSIVSRDSCTSSTIDVDTVASKTSRSEIESEISSDDDDDDDDDDDYSCTDSESNYSLDTTDDDDEYDVNDPYFDISDDPIMKEMMMNVLAKKKKGLF